MDMEESKSEKKIFNLLNNLPFKSDFTDKDLAYVNSDNAKTLKTFLNESFNNTSSLFKSTGVYNQYIVLKIYTYIQLEHNYSLQGYSNTAEVELANFDITNEIINELDPIEKMLIRNPHLNCTYSVNLNFKREFYFKSTRFDKCTILMLKNYDLDISFYIESKE